VSLLHHLSLRNLQFLPVLFDNEIIAAYACENRLQNVSAAMGNIGYARVSTNGQDSQGK
jgi:hypothetical protein